MAESYTDILRGGENSGCDLETISFPTIVTKAGNKRRGMSCVCLTDRDIKCGKFSQLFIMCVQGPN